MTDAAVQETDPPAAPSSSPPQQQFQGGSGGGPVDACDYFPDTLEDFSHLTWGHGVNSRPHLEAMLEDPEVMMLEADVILGQLKVEDEVKLECVPVMGHPPQTTSDLTFEMWLDQVVAANMEGKKKGIKVDFKDVDIVKECLILLQSRNDQISFPVWLNADILAGPIDSPTPPISANKFISTCSEIYPQATLSLGWTTHIPGTGTAALTSGYTREDVERMVEVLDIHAAIQTVTFPIRAAFLPHSLDALEWLLDRVPDSSLTIWSAKDDPFDPMAIVTLRDLMGPDAVYLDLPPAQMSQYVKVRAASVPSGGTGDTGGIASYLPNSTHLIASAAMTLVSALAALYLYE